MEYIDLHIHTEYTKGNGITKISELVKKAQEFNMGTLAITDSGNIDGFYEFVKECRSVNIKPVLGCGFYFAPMGLKLKETEHLVLLAKNKEGYDNILKMVEFSRTIGLSHKPRIDFKILKKYSTGLICLTGGLGGVFDKPFIAGNKNMALENLTTLKYIFKSNLYLELQDNELELNTLIVDEIIKVSNNLDIEMIVTGGSFYLDRDDAIKCNELREKYGNKTLKGNGYFFKSPKVMISIFRNHEAALNNSVFVANSITNFDIVQQY